MRNNIIYRHTLIQAMICPISNQGHSWTFATWASLMRVEFTGMSWTRLARGSQTLLIAGLGEAGILVHAVLPRPMYLSGHSFACWAPVNAGKEEEGSKLQRCQPPAALPPIQATIPPLYSIRESTSKALQRTGNSSPFFWARGGRPSLLQRCLSHSVQQDIRQDCLSPSLWNTASAPKAICCAVQGTEVPLYLTPIWLASS